MKKFLLLSTLLFATPSFAQSQTETKVYRPFRYETPCALQSNNEFLKDNCVVIETRESGGALRTRNIYSNRFGLTIKMRWDEKQKKYIQYDSHNQFEYKWEYKVGGVDGPTVWTEVMPAVLLQNISWD